MSILRPLETSKNDPWIGIQMGAHTMYDEVDAEGRASGRRCVCNPDWNAFSHATLEHLCAVGDTLKAMNLKS